MNTRPGNANEGCVGPASEQAGKSEACAGCPNQSACASGEGRKEQSQDPAIALAMSKIKHRILVLSGKGGVGKSTFSTQLAFGLAKRGCKVGLLDVDVCGPSVPTMMGLNGREVHQSASGWSPVYVDVDGGNEESELGVMSIGFLMTDQDAAVIWRGPRKTGLLTQFFGAVDWGELDYLVIDTPPGTSDEHISIVQLLKQSMTFDTDGAIVVTTPQEVAMADVRKELSFCKQTNIRVIGIVENMAPMSIPLESLVFQQGDQGEDCTEATMKMLQQKCPELFSGRISVSVDVFPRAGGGPEEMAKKFSVPFLGRVPLTKHLQEACDKGVPGLLSATSPAAYRPVSQIVDKLIQSTDPNLLEEKLRLKKQQMMNRASGGVVSVQNGKLVM